MKSDIGIAARGVPNLRGIQVKLRVQKYVNQLEKKEVLARFSRTKLCLPAHVTEYKVHLVEEQRFGVLFDVDSIVQ